MMSVSSVKSFSMEMVGRPDMNLVTESKRILYVLDKTIARVKFVGVLKSLISEDGYLLSDILSSEDHFYIVQICRKYEFIWNKFSRRKESFVESLPQQSVWRGKENEPDGIARSSSTSDESSDESLETDNRQRLKLMEASKRLDIELSKVILLLEEYPKVHQLAAKIENEMSPQMRFFIRCLEELRRGVAIHLGESAAQEKAREEYLRECYNKNEKAKQEIEKLEKELLEHRTDANYCIIGRNVLINRHQNKINKIEKASREAVEKRVKESERAMANDWKASIAIQKTLTEELKATTIKYETLLKDDLAMEKLLRAKRSKVENQLLGWLQKFDQDIGEKQAEEEEIQALLDEQNNELKKIRLKLEEQEEEYDDLMQEKAEYELELLERRLYIFILNRSARRIQRYFRLYKAKKNAKKKAKKERKEKKDKKGKKGGKKG